MKRRFVARPKLEAEHGNVEAGEAVDVLPFDVWREWVAARGHLLPYAIAWPMTASDWLAAVRVGRPNAYDCRDRTLNAARDG